MSAIGSLFVKIGSEFNEAGFSKAKTSMDKMRTGINDLAKVGAVMGTALVAAGLKAAQMAGVQEQAELTLAQAMKQAGTYTEEAMEHNKAYAASLQKVTTYGDENILSVQKQLTNFGIEGKMLDQLTKATLDLAAAKGMDLKSAGDLVAKSVGSSTNALTRYGITIEGSVGSTERAQMAVENITKLFGGAATAQADTYLGKQQQLSNQFGDIIEKIGFAVIPVMTILMKLIQQLILPGLEEFFNKTENVDAITNTLVTTFKILTSMILGLMQAFKIVGDAIATTAAFWVKLFSGDIKGAFAVAKEGFSDMGQSMMNGAEDIKKIWQKAEKDKTKTTKTETKKVKGAWLDTLNEITTSVIDNNAIRLNNQIETDTILAENAAINKEQKLADGNELLVASKEYLDELYKYEVDTGTISLENYRAKLAEQIASADTYNKDTIALMRELDAVDKELSETKKKRFTELMADITATTNAYGGFLSNFASYQSTLIQNNLQENLETEHAKYEDKKKWIEENITDEEQKAAMLEQLERDLKDTERTLNDNAKKEEANRRKALRPYLIAEAIMNTAIGVTKAFAQGGILGFATGALVAAAGAVQIATIKAQKFAKGVRNFIGGAAVVGEEGPELVTLPRGANVFSNPDSRGMLAGVGAGGGNINIDLRGSIISSKKAYKEFEDSIYKSLKNNRKIQ